MNKNLIKFKVYKVYIVVWVEWNLILVVYFDGFFCIRKLYEIICIRYGNEKLVRNIIIMLLVVNLFGYYV